MHSPVQQNNKKGSRDWLRAELSTASYPRVGAMMDVVFIRSANKAAYFEMGSFGTGVVSNHEFHNARSAIKKLAPGDVISAKIVALDGDNGFLDLSIAEATRQKSWSVVQDLFETGEETTVKVVGVNPGGLLVQVDELKGFLPISQMKNERLPEDGRQPTVEGFKEFLNEEFPAKVINVNPKKNKLIVSEREQGETVNLKEILENYKADDVIKGTVSGLADFGIFVRFADHPQVEGLVHISEIDHRIVDNPKDFAEMNDQVEVKILEIKDGRVYLSLKALKEDPWKEKIKDYTKGKEVDGTVYKLTAFGALVNLPDGLQGSIHAAAFDGGLDELKEHVEEGKEYSFVVDSVKADDKRIVLELKK